MLALSPAKRVQAGTKPLVVSMLRKAVLESLQSYRREPFRVKPGSEVRAR